MTDWALAVGSTTEVWSEQPTLQPPPKCSVDLDRSLPPVPRSSASDRPPSSRRRHSTWIAEGKAFATRPLSRASFASTRRSSRPTIGAPTDFKRVQSGRISPVRRTQPFRPLQLSIYLPGNELPDLPIFWTEDEEEDEDAGVERPVQALLKSKSDPMLLRRPSYSFSIPRKPLPSRSSSIDATRFSMNSCFTFADLPTQLQPRQSQSMDRLRSSSVERRNSVATTQSTLDFLDALDCKFPRPPPTARLRSSSNTPEPEFAIYRKASDQSLRLRTHLEERQSLQKHLPDLAEEVSPVSPIVNKKLPLSPIPDHDDTADCDSILELDHSSDEKDWQHNTANSVQLSSHQARSSSGSSTLLNPPTPYLDPFRPETPSVTTKILSTHPSQSSLRNRLSNWLLKALPTAPVPADNVNEERRASTPLSLWSESATANELSRMHTKQSSMSSSYWGRGSVDVEKAMVPMVPVVPTATNVGVAF
ncbi:hypothetical protein MMC21_006301 [Puttea exsequens]|nr:hypothetical protein [Puttea exsequens]